MKYFTVTINTKWENKDGNPKRRVHFEWGSFIDRFKM